MYTALSAFTAIRDIDEYNPGVPRLIVNTPEREERFKKRKDNIVELERAPQSRLFTTDKDGNQVDITNQVLDSIFEDSSKDTKTDKS